MVAVVKRILTDVEMHLLKETATVWAVWFACVWWRKSILHVYSGKMDLKLAGNDVKYSTKDSNK